MKKYLLIPICLLLFFNARAQDKIITVKNDTIQCTIVSVSNERLIYEIKYNDGSVSGRSIPLSQVAEYKRYFQPGVASIKNKTQEPKNMLSDGIHLCLGLDAGGSAMPWYMDNFEASPAEADFYNKLKTGIHLNAGAHYIIKNFLGLGAEYSFFTTNISGNVPVEYSSSIYLLGSDKCRQYFNYLGGSLLFRQALDVQHKFVLGESVSAGIMFVRLEEQTTYPHTTQLYFQDITNNMLLTGNSFCAKFKLSAEYKIYKAVSIGLSGDFLWSTLKKGRYKLKGSDNSSYSSGKEKLADPLKQSRIDYSVIVRYSF